MTENKSREWFESRGFMDGIGMTTSSFLFRFSRLESSSTMLENTFNTFMERHLEKATNDNEIPIDLILTLVSIDSIVDFMKDEFIHLCRIDESYLEEDAIELLISILCEPSRFFNLYKTGRKS